MIKFYFFWRALENIAYGFKLIFLCVKKKVIILQGLSINNFQFCFPEENMYIKITSC